MIWDKLINRLFAELDGRDTLRKVLTNSGWLFFDKFLRMTVGLFVGIWLARYLGVTQYGQLNYAIAFVSLFGAIATLGLDGIVVRDLVRKPDQKNIIIGSAFTLKLLGGFLAMFFAVFSIWIIRPDEPLFFWLTCIIAAGMIFQCLDVFDLWFQSQVQSRFTVIAKSSAFLIISAIKILLILTGADILAFAWAGLAEILIGAVGIVIAYRYAGGGIGKFSASLQMMRNLLAESWPLILSGLAIMLYMRIDQVMLGEMAGEAEVGLYSAALRLSEVWYVIPVIIISSVMPTLTATHGNSETLYYQRLQRLFSLLARAAYLVAIPMTVFSTSLVSTLFGDQFAAAGPILAVHIWAALFVFLGVGMTPWIINESLTKFSLFQTLLGATVNIFMNLKLIPEYGGLGASISTLISQIVATYLALAFFKRTRKVFLMETRAIMLR